MQKIGFGGGCHWCTEGVFQALLGVVEVKQGFIQSDAPWDAWSEGVLVHFDPAIIDLGTLAEVHLRTHSGNGTYSPGGRYRSAIYVFDSHQRQTAALMIDHIATESGAPARTMVLPFVGFKPSDARYQNYYRSNPSRPFCRRYIDPKLDYIRRNFAAIARP
jgi:peptide-methionine (S)-S-oxide reductase